jgi:hypothetical protein
VASPLAELVSLVVAVVAAAGFAGFGAGGSGRVAAGGAADAPAPGESVRDTSPFSGSAGAALAGLSAAASGAPGPADAGPDPAACSSRGEDGIRSVSAAGFCESSAIHYTQSSAPFCQA